MKIRKIKCMSDGVWLKLGGSPKLDWEVSYTIIGDRKWHYIDVKAEDEMQAYIKASNLAQDHELKVARRVVNEWNYIKKRMPSAELTKDIAKAKQLLTDVNKTQVRKS